MRGNGRCFLRGQTYWIAYYLRGLEYRESAGTDSLKTATAFLRERLKEVAADQIGARAFVTPKASKLTVGELIDALRSDYELRGKLSAQNASNLRRVEQDFGNFSAVGLTAERIDAYVEGRLAEGDAKASINRTTQLLSQAYKMAIARRHLTQSPHVRHLSEKGNERQGFVDPANFAKVLAELPDDLKDFCAWSYVTGQRKGEANSLTWSMIEDDSLRIPGRITKNGKDRVLPLVGELSEIIERRRLARRIEVGGTSTTKLCDLIFHRNGAPVRELRKSWKTATRKAGCPGLLLHDLRRSACRNLRKAGVPEQVAMQVSGHRTTSIFQRYSIVDTADVSQALERTEQYRATAKQKVVAIK